MTDILTLDGLDGYREPRVGEYYLTAKPVAGRDLRLDGAIYNNTDYPAVASRLAAPFKPPSVLGPLTTTTFNLPSTPYWRRNPQTGTIILFDRNGSFSRIHRTTNNGASWTEVSLPLPGGNYLRDLAFGKDGVVIATSSNTAYIYKSVDDGASFALVAGNIIGITLTYAPGVASDMQGNWCIVCMNSGQLRVTRSSNNGASWATTTYQMQVGASSLYARAAAANMLLTWADVGFVAAIPTNYGVYDSWTDTTTTYSYDAKVVVNELSTASVYYPAQISSLPALQFIEGFGLFSGINILGGNTITGSSVNGVGQQFRSGDHVYVGGYNSSQLPWVFALKPAAASGGSASWIDAIALPIPAGVSTWTNVAPTGTGMLLIGRNTSQNLVTTTIDMSSLQGKFQMPRGESVLTAPAAGGSLSQLELVLRAK